MAQKKLAPRSVEHKWTGKLDCEGRVGVEPAGVLRYVGHANGERGVLYLKFWYESTGDYIGWAEVEGRVVNNTVHYFAILPLADNPDEFREREYGSLNAVIADIAQNVAWEQETYGNIPQDSPVLFPPAQVWPVVAPADPAGAAAPAPAPKPAKGPRKGKAGHAKAKAKHTIKVAGKKKGKVFTEEEQAALLAQHDKAVKVIERAAAKNATEALWTINLAQFRRDYPKADPMDHRKAVEAAIAAGKPVGPWVLRDYPKLAKLANRK